MTASPYCWEIFSMAGLASRWGSRWESWLHPQEAARAKELGDASRRQAWILGRIAARQLLLEQVCPSSVCPRQIQIISQGAARRGCPPLVLIEGVVQAWSLSLAHSRDWVAVALAAGGSPVGIDVVDLDAVHPDRLANVLGAESWRAGRSRLATAVGWAVVESAFKSLGHQEPFRPGRFHLRLEGTSAVAWRYRGRVNDWSGHSQWWPRERAIVALTRQTLAGDRQIIRKGLAA
jgi:4'-phosphopantetheinyl transferase